MKSAATTVYTIHLRVFVCHASEDKPRARQLVSRLRKDGFDPWLDEERLLPGQDWQLEISAAVRQSDAVIVCLSTASVEKTGYVQKELRHVLDVAEYQPEGRIFVIPVRLEPCRVPERLSHWQYADLFLENGYERLREALTARAGVDAIMVSDRDSSTIEPRPVTERHGRWILFAFGAAIAVAAAALVWWYLRERRNETVVQRGDFQVFTTPGAEVRVDGKILGVADGSGALILHGLTATEHRIRIDRAGFKPEEQTVNVIGEMISSVTLDLRRIEVINGGQAQSPPDFRLSRRLSGQSSDLNGMLFIGRNQLLTYGSGAVLWDAEKGRQISAMKIDERIFCVSADLHWLAVRTLVQGTDAAQIVNAGTGRVVRQFTGYATTFTPDSKEVVILGEPGDERSAEFWDIESGTKRVTWKDRTIGHVRFSPDGRWIVTAGVGVSVRDRKKGTITRQFPTKGARVQALAFSADGRWLAVVHGRDIDIWELATGREGPTIIGSEPASGASAEFGDAAFMPDSGHILTANYSTVQVWDTATGREARQWPAKNSYQLAISTDGQWLAVNGDYLTVWGRVRNPK